MYPRFYSKKMEDPADPLRKIAGISDTCLKYETIFVQIHHRISPKSVNLEKKVFKRFTER